MFFLAPTLLVAGCATDLTQEIEIATRADAGKAMYEFKTRPIEGAIYNEVVDAWMIPQPDPYTLENFQKAYDNLAAGKSAQTLTKAQAGEFSVGKRLAPTHYALKIYPRDEAEQWRVEMMEDAQVAYIPFDYAQLTQDEAQKVEKANKRSAANTFAEKSPYTITYDYTEGTDGGPTGPQTFQLPILYTVWPADKPLPDDLEYVVDYEVFLPHSAATQAKSVEALTTLENEAVSAAFGIPASTLTGALTRAPAIWNISRRLVTYDDTLNDFAILPNLKVRVQSGTFISDTNSDASGFVTFSLPVPMLPITPTTIAQADITFTYQDPQGRWKIITENSTNPYSVTVFSRFYGSGGLPMPIFALSSGDRQENDIHRAMCYFFNGQIVFPKYIPSGGLKIIAYDESGDAKGSFAAPSTIRVYNFNGTQAEVIGTIMHEVGHFTHYQNNVSRFINTDDFLIESFARYSGWYLGEQYYKSRGWTHPGGNPDIVGQTTQSWYKTYDTYFMWDNKPYYYGWYSPLFIDLADDYNQGANSSYYPNDTIQGVSASSVWSIITNSTTWAGTGQCRSRIVNLVGSSPDFSDWIDDFDYWTSHYPLKVQ